MSGTSVSKPLGDTPFQGDSIFNNPGQIWGGDNSFVRNPGQIWDAFKPNVPDTPSTPAPPDPGNIRQNQLNQQVQNEGAQRANRSLFTAGTGLLDAPTTASKTLLGA